MAGPYNQHILILGHNAKDARIFAETLLASEPTNDIRYTLIHPNAAQILLRLTGISALETTPTSQDFADALKTADGIICLIPFETGIAQTLVPLCEEHGIKRIVFCTRENNLHPPAFKAHTFISEGLHALVKSNLDWTLLRPTTLVGGSDDPLQTFTDSLKHTRLKFRFIGRKTAKTFIQPMNEADLAKALLRAFENPATLRQSYTLSGPKPLRVGMVLDHLCKQHGKRLLVLPYWGRQRILPKWLMLSRKNPPLNVANLRRSLIATHEKAFRHFGFVPSMVANLMKDEKDD